jgi:hypothetical protein
MIPINIISKKDFTRDLENYLNEVNNKWLILKRTLEKLETSLQNQKHLSRELMTKVDNLSQNSGQLSVNYESVYDDILSRIRHDIESSDSMIS